MVQLTHGVRQGGVLSPIFFSIYVDEMLLNLNHSGAGCRLAGVPVAALMYADDILLISASVTHLQHLVTLCACDLKKIDLFVNSNKSFWTRIGSKFKSKCADIVIGDAVVKQTEEIKYLGSLIVAASTFAISVSCNKTKFFGNANKIFGKIGTSNVPVLMNLVNSYCISALLYNLEVFDINKSTMNSLNFALTRMYMKIFKTSSVNIVQFSLFNFGQLPIDLLLYIRKYNYLCNLLKKKDSNYLINAFSDIIHCEKNVTTKNWSALGDGLTIKVPCKREAWLISSARAASLEF